MDLNKPKPFAPNKNRLAKDWQIWKKEFIVYLRLTEAYTKTSEEQRALLLINLMGTEAFQAMEQISFENACDKRDMDILLIKFDEFFNPPVNIVQERYKFFSRRKNPDEDIDKYVMDLMEKAKKCDFGNQSEKFIVDLLILSMDSYLQNIIWALKLDSLSDIIQCFKQYTINEAKVKELVEDTEPTPKENPETGNEQAQGYKKPVLVSNVLIPANCMWTEEDMHHLSKECPDKICQKSYSNFDVVVSSSSKQSETTTSNLQQIQKQTPKVNQMQDCLWCGFPHVQGQCSHDPNCKSCGSFPHDVCFECKQSPHDQNCSKQQMLTVPSIKNYNVTQANEIKSCAKCEKNHEDTACKYCCYCQKNGHWDSECVRKYNKSTYGAEQTISTLLDNFAQIGNISPTTTNHQIELRRQRIRKSINVHQHKCKSRSPKKSYVEEKKAGECCIS